MTDRQKWALTDFDVCQCGDYRRQHQGGVGRCELGSLCTPSPCLRFRLSKLATEIPPPYDKLADIRSRATVRVTEAECQGGGHG